MSKFTEFDASRLHKLYKQALKEKCKDGVSVVSVMHMYLSVVTWIKLVFDAFFLTKLSVVESLHILALKSCFT